MPPDDRLISVTRAVTIASERGVPVNRFTVLQAAIRGSIAEARKVGNAWKFPAWAFDDWLAVHATRKPYGTSKGEA
ncbi:MAG: hypothetical protein ACKO9F_18330 [Caldilinea sp.]